MNNKINSFLKELVIIFTIIATGISALFGMNGKVITPPDSNYPLGEALPVAEKNIDWPENQIFPYFAEPEGELIAFPDNILSHKEMVALASLQGVVNAIQTRVAILAGEPSIGCPASL